MKKSLLIIIIILVFTLMPSIADAETRYYLNTNSKTKITVLDAVENDELQSYRAMYDITKLKFNDNKTLDVEGWAAIGYRNNWGGVYSAIGIAVGKDSETPNTFQEVTYTNETNYFGWRCERGTDYCESWKKTNKDETRVEYERKAVCHGDNYGCLFRDISFHTTIDISSALDEYPNTELAIYLLISYRDGISYTDNSELIKWENNKATPVATTIYNNSITKYGSVIKIGVDKTSCYVGNRLITDPTSVETSNYRITFRDISEEIYMTQHACSRLMIKKEKKFYSWDDANVTSNPIDDCVEIGGYRGKYSDTTLQSAFLRDNWNSVSKVKMFKVSDMPKATLYSQGTNIDFNGYWVPAAWVQQSKTLKFKLEENKTCDPPNQTNNTLECANPEKVYEYYDDSDDCVELFTESKNGKSIMVEVSFSQKGKMSVILLNRYIKSGQAFSLSATYTDEISWTIQKIRYSGDPNNNEKKSLNNEIIKDIRTWFTQSELVARSNAKAYFNGRQIEGTWTIDKKSGTDMVPNNFVFAENKSHSFTVTGKFELLNAYSNSNVTTTSGVNHIYTNNISSEDAKKYIFDGKVYYTDLSLPEDDYPVKLEIQGLSGLKYHTNSEQILWKLNYECSIHCYQDYYNTPPNGTPTDSSQYQGYKFKYRVIDKDDPFPIVSGNTIGLDQNWINWAKAIAKETNDTDINIGLNKIKERLSNAYDESNLNYRVIIDGTTGIKTIKNYNLNRNYVSSSGDFYEISDNITRSKFLAKYTQGEGGVKIVENSNITKSNIGSCTVPQTGLINSNCFCSLSSLVEGKCEIK